MPPKIMSPKIENPANVVLAPEAVRVLQRIFVQYAKIIIKKEFGSGLSGGRVFEVRPIRADGTPELPTIVKLAPISLIQQEWQAYQQHVQNRLPRISQVTAPPVLLPKVGWGGLRYTMMGEGAFEVVSLRDYCRQAETSAAQIATVVDYLLRIMRNIWGYNYACENFQLHASYDQALPVHLLVQPIHEPAPAPLRIITPANLGTGLLHPGESVCLDGFVVHKVNRDTQTITLRSPRHKARRAQFAKPAYFLRYKVPVTKMIAAWQANQVVGDLSGEVIETRDSRLHEEVRRALGENFDPNAPTVLIAEQTFANPLVALPQLLKQIRTVNIAAIHGDFNLENILIEPETLMVSLIDFADAREDHVLHDYLRLETEVLTRLIPEILHKANLPTAPILAYFFWRLHQAAFQNSSPPLGLPQRELEKPWAILQALRRTVRTYCADANDLGEYYQGLTLYLLGALKFKNLNDVPEQPLPKQIAFWGATLAYHLLTTPLNNIDHPTLPLMALIDPLKAAMSASERPSVSQSVAAPLLAEAERLLAALPTETIAPLGPLPSFTRLTVSRNPLFVGRTQDLKQIAIALRGDAHIGGDPVRPVIVTGLGGLGKTQLVSEFAHRYGRFFAGGVFWLSFADPRAVPAEIAGCGGVGALALRPDFAELSLDEQVRLVTTAWQADLPRLLIFDNCEDPSLLARWRPASGGCRVLVTSRRAEWSGALRVQTRPLDVLSRTESIALLHEHRPNADEAMLDQVAQEVGDLPLALHLAGSYLARYRRSLTVDNYLAQLRDAALIEHHSLQTGGVSPTGHEQNVSRTIALSFNRLDRADPSDDLALALLARAACLAPGEPIPYPLLLLTLNTAGDTLSEANTPQATPKTPTPHAVEDAVNRLAELGLLRSTTPDVVQFHRLVLAFGQNALAAEMPMVQATVERTLCHEAEQLNEAGYPAALLVWQAHLRTIVNAASDRDDEQAARLCHALGEHFRQIGDYERARICMERVVAIRQKIFGEEHEATARSLTDLGEIFELQDKRAEARARLEQALAIQEKVLGDHPDTATTLSHLGYHLHNRGYLDEAHPYHERALAIRRKVLGEEHPLVAFTLCHLAYIEYRKENHVASRATIEQALAIQEKTLGVEHPEIARTFQNLGELLMVGQSDLAGAQQAFERALAIQQKVLAEEHPENARLFNNLAELHYSWGHMGQAKLYLEAALTIRRKMLGEEHVDTAIIFYDMGRVAQAQGNSTEARQLYLRALKSFNARLNSDHYLIRFTQTYLKSLDST